MGIDCRWCKREFTGRRKRRRARGGCCIPCDKFMYKKEPHKTNTSEKRKLRLKELADSQEEQQKWNASVDALDNVQTERGIEDGLEPERSMLDDDINQVEEDRLVGRTLYGYFVKEGSIKKHLKLKPNDAKVMTWSGEKGICIFPEDANILSHPAFRNGTHC
jgi:hypothetical protein